MLNVTSGRAGGVLCAAAERQRIMRRVARMIASLFAHSGVLGRFLNRYVVLGPETVSVWRLQALCSRDARELECLNASQWACP